MDDRLVMPGTRYEILDGKLMYVAAADEPHGRAQSRLAAVLEAYVVDGYDVAADLLTRTSEIDDMAPDASVYPSARDPETGGRQLEELAFEVVSKQRLSAAGRKAAKLAARGVRRIFALDVKRKRALEYDAATGTWKVLARDASIDDRVLALALPVCDLVDAAHADDAMARALLAKNNPVLAKRLHAERVEGRVEGRAEGRAQALAEALLVVLEARGLAPTAAEIERIRSTRDEQLLIRWLGDAPACRDVGELLAQ